MTTQRGPRQNFKEQHLQAQHLTVQHPKVLFAAPEVAPFSKVGGLGDVTGSLPKALLKCGVDVRVVTPLWPGVMQKIKEAGCKISTLSQRVSVTYAWSVADAAVHRVDSDGVPIYFLEGDYYSGDIYPWDLNSRTVRPFAAFCMQALELEKVTGWSPDIFHCHDWTSAFLPCALAWHRHYRGMKQKSVLTLHNVAHQGMFPPGSFFEESGLDPSCFNIGGLEFYGQVNLLKGGIVSAAAVTTVSPRYAWEIQTYESTQALSGVIYAERRKLTGILNGIDIDYWNPATDPMLPECYSAASPAGKTACRRELLKNTNFDPAYEGPLVVCVSRLVEQKGFDIILPALKQLDSLGAKFIFLGSGQRWIEDALRNAAAANKDSLCFVPGYNEPLAHLLYAGGDIYLMPSLFEPCGLSQMIAMRYGTVPVVREVGGLIDTVTDADADGGGNGFTFLTYDTRGMLWSLRRAIERHSNAKAWNKIRLRGMEEDFSWNRPAALYRDLYRSVL
ncbi:MAG: glycogen synthase [Synergistaceae bacterium]|jgi:starch synthase|nr:glycogen synthase [Synergistaceae bacterium]